LNVSKGQVASHEDLKASFDTTDVDKIILEILKKGELQVGEKERQAKLQQQHAEVVELVASKCVNPSTKRPYPTTIIEKALLELGISISTNKSSKAQALDVIKQLVSKQIIPIARAHMRIRLTGEAKDAKKYRDAVVGLIENIENEGWSNEWECIGFIEPGKYREISDLLRNESKGRANIEVLDMAVIQEGEEAF